MIGPGDGDDEDVGGRPYSQEQEANDAGFETWEDYEDYLEDLGE